VPGSALHFCQAFVGLFLEKPFALTFCRIGRLSLVFAEWGIGRVLLSMEDAALGGEVPRAAEEQPEEPALHRSQLAVYTWSMPARNPVMRRPKYAAMNT
jgi:hypothetical protein